MTHNYALSFSGKLSAALALCYVALPASADIQSQNSNTQVQRQNRVEIVNIAAPSASGLSHNKYQKFNVDKQGAVLNNALQAGRSELAGQLAKNPNLNQKAATVILNEVVSRNPSTLSGKQEVFGQRADYVLANPNGISCNDCGFINTPRASLVVGAPTVEAGKLTGYQVSGDNRLTTSGKMTNHNVNEVDLIAPTVNVSGNLSGAKQLNVVMGRNQVKRADDGALTIAVSSQQGTVLDGKVAGSMQAGRIRIHSTDNRAVLDISNADITTKEMVLSAGNAIVQGVVTQQTLRSKSEGTEGRRVRVSRESAKTTEQHHRSTLRADALAIDVSNQLVINGTDIQAKKAVIQAGDVRFGTQQAADTAQKTVKQSKGRWFRNETDSSRTENLHRSTVSADTLNIVATKGKITGKAVKVTAKSAQLYAEKGMDFEGGVSAKYEYARSDFRNETARLKTGISEQSAMVKNLIASEFNIEKTLAVGGKGDVNFVGVKGTVNDKLLVSTSGKVNFTSQSTKNSFQLNDKQRFWGGLAGSKTLGTGKTEERQHGADFTIKGLAVVNADKGVNLKASRVLAGEGYVNSAQGHLVIDSASNKVSQHQNSRTGTLFDITKARQNVYSYTITSQGSTLHSDSNLKLVSQKDIAVIGSKVDAVGQLDLLAKGKVLIRGAENQHNEGLYQAGFSLTGKVNKPTIKLDEEGLVDGIFGVISAKKVTLEDAKKLTLGNLKVNAEASATLGIYNNQQATESTTHTASSVSGGNVNVNAQSVTVAGSQVTANQGDLAIQANNIQTTAQHNQVNTHKKETNAGITTKVKLTESSVSTTVDIGVNHSNSQQHNSTAQGSQLSAAENLNLQAQHIGHQGSQLSAGSNLIQNANTISHTSAQNSTDSQSKNIKVGLTVNAGINKQKAVNGSATLSAEGGRETGHSVTHTGTQLNAGNHIVGAANNVVDQGSQYQAGGDVIINSNQHRLESVQNTNHTDSVSAGVSVGVKANSKDLQTVNVAVSVAAKYQQNHNQSSQAQKTTVQGNNVNIQTGNLYSQADIQANESATLNARQNAVLTQSTNTQSSSAGGVSVNLGVGALVIPAAGVAIPSIDVGVQVNGQRGNQSDAVLASVQGKDISISSQKNTQIQGTNIQASDSATISGNTVHISSGASSAKNVAVDVGAEVGIGANLADAKLKTNLNVQHQNSSTATGVAVNGNTVNIQAQNGVVLSGISSQANTLNINTGKGDLILAAPVSSENKTGVAVGLSLSGAVAENTWTPSGGNASLDVNVIRNQTYTPTILTADSATLNVGGNANLQGSTVNAGSLSGNISGNLTNVEAINRINETSVSLSASGSGKATAYPADKWQASFKKDVDNGTIAGVKAEVNANIVAKRQTSVVPASVKASKKQLQVKGKKTHIKAPKASKKYLAAIAKMNTNMSEMVKRAQADIKNKRFPWVSVSTKP